MAELVFYSGTMNCGKSTLALQTAYNYHQLGQRSTGAACSHEKERADAPAGFSHFHFPVLQCNATFC